MVILRDEYNSLNLFKYHGEIAAVFLLHRLQTRAQNSICLYYIWSEVTIAKDCEITLNVL